MQRTASLRRQHDSALALVREISAMLADPAYLSTRAGSNEAGLSLAKLTGLLRIHFAQEDQYLYPSLMTSNRQEVAQMAQQFFDEMGQLRPVYFAYATKWSAGDAIRTDPQGFCTESQAVFAALGDRIKRENEGLYPLADEGFGHAN